jgi:hypothetical protein
MELHKLATSFFLGLQSFYFLELEPIIARQSLDLALPP